MQMASSDGRPAICTFTIPMSVLVLPATSATDRYLPVEALMVQRQVLAWNIFYRLRGLTA